MQQSLHTEALAILEQADCLYTTEAIEATLDALANKISKDYHDKNPVILCVMKGGLYFTSELLKRFHFALQLDYLHVTRYQNSTRGNALEWRVKPEMTLQNRHVLVLDDILDQGITIQSIQQTLKEQGCASVAAAVLVRKIHNDKNFAVDVTVKYIGLDVPDRYVFGCGMDYKSYHRNLVGIYAVSEKNK